jgi:predicted transcriptional regulator
MERLTRKEEEIMQVLWKLKKAFVKEIMEKLPDPKPHYNTVSTLIRKIEDKSMIDHEVFGHSHRYFPKVSKDDYARMFMKKTVSNYFGNSYKELVSFFAKDEKLSEKDLKDILKMIKKKNNN